MVFPIIPITAIAAIAGGSFALGWYFNLSKEKQEEANKIANSKAKELFGKAADQLASPEAEKVIKKTQEDYLDK